MCGLPALIAPDDKGDPEPLWSTHPSGINNVRCIDQNNRANKVNPVTYMRLIREKSPFLNTLADPHTALSVIQ